MAGFFDIQRGGWKVWGLIASAVLVLVGGGATIIDQSTGGGLSQETYLVPLKCSSQSCGWSGAITYEEKAKMATKDFEAWKAEHPGQYPIPIDEAAVQDSMKENETLEQVISKMIVPNWGTLESNLPLTCPKCKEKTVFQAYQCAKCKEIFFLDMSQTPVDKCPKCGFSKSEEKAKEEAATKKKR